MCHRRQKTKSGMRPGLEKNTTMSEKQTFSICISTDALAWLDAQANALGISRSRFIDEVVLRAKAGGDELDELRIANKALVDSLKEEHDKFEALAKAAGELSRAGQRMLKENDKLEAENNRLRAVIRGHVEHIPDDSKYFTLDGEDDDDATETA